MSRLRLRRKAFLVYRGSAWKARTPVRQHPSAVALENHRQDGPEILPEVTALLRQAVGEQVFPGAAFGVLLKGKIVALDAVGRFTYDAASPPVTAATTYDLASVTKVVATTGAAMLLWQGGRLELDAPLADLLPGFVVGQADPRRRLVTLRMLLAHSSGLPAYHPLFKTCRSPAELLRSVLQLPLETDPGTRAAYSDPGFILLGKALEVLAGETLDRFCEREVFAPLGMRQTRFRPFPFPAIPPTEEDRDFRHRTVQGEVHDENCSVLGGVAGHAGLFAPAADLLRFAEATLAPLHGRAGVAPLFRAETIKLFTTPSGLPHGSSRALGWDTPSQPSSSGTSFSPTSYGHLGYTGTSLWIDPEADLAVVLLTNRTFPTRENWKLQDWRPRFHDQVRRSLPTSVP